MALVKRLIQEQQGADATEYGLVVGLVALAIVVGAVALGGNINNALSQLGTHVNSCTQNGVTSC